MRHAGKVFVLLLGLYLGLADGYLAVYRCGNKEPLQVLPYCGALFSDADRRALREGIPFSTEEDFNRLLEDFTS